MKILIADDHELFLKGLEFILNDISDNISVSLAKNYNEIFDILDKDKNFDLILTDLAMPGAKWTDAIDKIHTMAPNTPIIIISAVFDSKVVNKTIEIGVSGFIHKTSSNEEIKKAINIVTSGGMYIPSELLNDELKNSFASINQIDFIDDTKDSHLSPRQLDVINFMSKGFPNKQIAFELGITEGTVKLYITEIFKKLSVFNRTSAVIEANQRGLIKK